jgi:hypothetical protein
MNKEPQAPPSWAVAVGLNTLTLRAIADRGQQAQPSEKDNWIALGVFGMVKGEETEANQIFQLAVNKDGILRGNYYDALSDSTLPVFGSVDKQTQHAAWTVGDRKETV